MTPIARRSLILAVPALLVPAAARAVLPPTPGATEGPFYPVRIPPDDDNDLVRVEGAVREAGGEVLHLAGTVLDRDARPAAGARIEIWQCDVNGIYLHPRDRMARRDGGFQGFGHATSDRDGRFAFRTIVPVPYSGRTPHIHLKALLGGRELLTTQFYRAGFPQNPSDFLFRNLSPAAQAQVSMTLVPRKTAPRPTFDAAIRVVLPV